MSKELDFLSYCVATGKMNRRAFLGRLKDELDRWGIFEEYEDRFFNIFKKKR